MGGPLPNRKLAPQGSLEFILGKPMSDGFVKCACRSCNGRIEFPAHAVGLSIACPHCGATTQLYDPNAAAATTAAPPPPVRIAPPPPAPIAAPPPRPVGTSSLVPQVPIAVAPRLQVAAPPPPPPPTEEDYAQAEAAAAAALRRPAPNWIGITLAGVSIALALIGGLMYWNNKKRGKDMASPQAMSSARKSARSGPTSTASAQADAAEEEEPPARGVKNINSATSDGSSTTAAAAKSVDDLKVSNITLQKTPGSALVYAMGTMKNNSDQQRFGVRLELDLLDASGKKIGTTKDYAPVIEPRKDWRFRALIPYPKAASARVAKITEQE